jgi:uncharacterized membrane protein (UPF0127 family)
VNVSALAKGLVLPTLLALSAGAGGCEGPTAGRNDLNAMTKAALNIKEHRFEAWLAQTNEQITLGLMQVQPEELAPTETGANRGMLFVFQSDRPLGFWMYNTPTALDIAYIRSDGTIVKIWTMKPLDTSTYPSIEPARFALEVKAGLFAELGIFEGDVVTLPEGL